MTYTVPTVDDFKGYFDRDFTYGEGDPTKPQLRTVRDKDISAAMTRADVLFAVRVMASQEMYTTCYLLLTAHFVCEIIRASYAGVSGQFSWLQQSKSAGDVAESFAIPDFIKRNPLLASLSTTKYGAQYVAMIAPYLIGNVEIAFGDSTP